MIRGIHGLFYSSEPDQLRTFLRDQLQLPSTDIGGGWLIYDFQQGDLGVHPTEEGGQSGKHDISFFTDDLEATVSEITARGVTFEHEIEDHGYGLVTHVVAPGGVRIQIYQPKYDKPGATDASAATDETSGKRSKGDKRRDKAKKKADKAEKRGKPKKGDKKDEKAESRAKPKKSDKKGEKSEPRAKPKKGDKKGDTKREKTESRAKPKKSDKPRSKPKKADKK